MRVRHRCRDLLSEGIKLLIPTREECANCESLCNCGSGKDARRGPSYSVRSEFPHQTKGGGRKCIRTLGDANNQGDHTRHVALYELDLGNQWRQ